MFKLLRKARNFYSTKYILDVPKRVRRRPSYLKRLYFSKFEIKNINEEFFKNKYYKGQEQDVFFDKAPLPDIYYTNEIVLIPKNNKTLFAYWEIKEDTFRYLKESFEVYNEAVIYIYKKDKLYMKIENLPRFGSYYINNIKANREYKAVIGFENSYGDFFEVAESHYAIVPSGRVSKNRGFRWGIVRQYNGKLLLEKYDKLNLPNESVFRQEILDEDVLNFHDEKDGSFNIGFNGASGINGSSNIFIGSSNKN